MNDKLLYFWKENQANQLQKTNKIVVYIIPFVKDIFDIWENWKTDCNLLMTKWNLWSNLSGNVALT